MFLWSETFVVNIGGQNVTVVLMDTEVIYQSVNLSEYLFIKRALSLVKVI